MQLRLYHVRTAAEKGETGGKQEQFYFSNDQLIGFKLKLKTCFSLLYLVQIILCDTSQNLTLLIVHSSMQDAVLPDSIHCA